MLKGYNKKIGELLKQQRLMTPMTLQQLSDASGVSTSHLSRIEAGDRYPSAWILQRIAQPLGFEVKELFSLAGFLAGPPTVINENLVEYSGKTVDPDVIRALAEEPVEVQRAVIGLLNILKSIAGRMNEKTDSRKKKG